MTVKGMCNASFLETECSVVLFIFLSRRCDEKISKGALKIGVVTEGTWGPSTQWHHLQCTVFRITRPEDIVGFSDLDDALLVRLAI